MTKRQEKLLIAMCWLLYVSAYLGRYSYTTNILPISNFYNVEKDVVSLATTFFFFAYGAGQIINGLLCRFYKVKYVLSGALIASAVINLSIFLGLPFEYIKYMWLLNGVVQSVLWSSLLMCLSKNLDENYIKKAIIAMSTTASVGTFLAYGLSALLAVWGAFKFSFLVGALVMIVSAVLWIILYDGITKPTQDNKSEQVEQVAQEKCVQKKKIDGTVVSTLIIFGVVAVIINLMKDGLSTWVPNILSERYKVSDSLSILLTLILPVLAIFGTTFVVTLNKKIKEHAFLIAIVFGIASVLIGAVILLFKTPFWGIVLGAFGLVSLLMSGANNVVTSMIPLGLRDKANSGFIAGILNGCCYVGSTLSQFGLAVIATSHGWSVVFDLMFICGLVIVAIGAICGIIRGLKRSK